MKMMEQGEARSVYVMVTFEDSLYFGSLFEVKLDGQGGNKGECGATQEPPQLFKHEVKLDGQGGNKGECGATQEPPQLLKPVARFVAEKLSVHAVWNYCTMGSTKLYLLPDSGPDAQREVKSTKVPSLESYIFDVKTRRFVSSIKPPNAPKWFGRAVAADGNIYLLVDPLYSTDALEPSFERYDPINDSWTSLCSFPYSGRFGEKEILGNAFCDGIILFNVCGSGSEELWAYDVIENVWHPVQVKNIDCYSFRGTAVVVEETIYALSTFPGVVVAFSIRRDQTDEGHVVTCSLGSLLYSQELLNHPSYAVSRTGCIVHLGEQEFCVVQTGFNDEVDNDCQGLKITTFQIVGGSEIEIIHSTVYEVELGDSESLDVEFCFTPDCEDIVPSKEKEIATPMNQIIQKEEEETGVAIFYLTPECEDKEPEEFETTTSSNQPEQEENMGNGSICLPPKLVDMITAAPCEMATSSIQPNQKETWGESEHSEEWSTAPNLLNLLCDKEGQDCPSVWIHSPDHHHRD